MGYLKEKYTENYFLNLDENGNKSDFGVEGIDEFYNGRIRLHDWNILRRLNFKGKSVFDIGFGRGEALKFAQEKGAKELSGVDFAESAVKIATNHLKKHNIKINLSCNDILDYAKIMNNNCHDIILLLDVVEHIPRSELKEALDLLKQKHFSKKLVLAVNTPVFGDDNDVILEGLKDQARDLSDENALTANMHCNRYTAKSLISFMEESGFMAISQQFFINSNNIPNFLTYRLRWLIAYFNGYPLKFNGIILPTRREFAMSSIKLNEINNSKNRNFKNKISRNLRSIPFIGQIINYFKPI